MFIFDAFIIVFNFYYLTIMSSGVIFSSYTVSIPWLIPLSKPVVSSSDNLTKLGFCCVTIYDKFGLTINYLVVEKVFSYFNHLQHQQSVKMTFKFKKKYDKVGPETFVCMQVGGGSGLLIHGYFLPYT